MSHALRSRTAKRNANRKTAKVALFEPAAFLGTAGVGRDISTYSKKEIIFSQGDDADAIFYIKKGKIKVAVLSTNCNLIEVTFPDTCCATNLRPAGIREMRSAKALRHLDRSSVIQNVANCNAIDCILSVDRVAFYNSALLQ